MVARWRLLVEGPVAATGRPQEVRIGHPQTLGRTQQGPRTAAPVREDCGCYADAVQVLDVGPRGELRLGTSQVVDHVGGILHLERLTPSDA